MKIITSKKIQHLVRIKFLNTLSFSLRKLAGLKEIPYGNQLNS
jgi:hypothetical protein